MKKIITISFAIVLALTITKCKKPDNVIYDVLDTTNSMQGAILRTIDRVNTAFDFSDLSSTFEVIVEEQDPEYGDLLDKVNIYVSFIDNFDDGNDYSKDEILYESVPKSSFTKSENDLPLLDYLTTFQDVLNAFNLQTGEYNPGDSFKFRFEIVLTDGRKFSAENSGSTVQQSFFRSPFVYYADIVCPPVSGDYTVVLHDSYGDGWQGSKIIVKIDGNDAYELSLPNYWEVGTGNVGDPEYVQQSFTVTVPSNFQTLNWIWVSGSWVQEATFEIYGPNSGNIIYQGGPSEPDGEFYPYYCDE